MKILIPMAGEGKRFKEAGCTFPKPLIEVRGKMMIEWAIEGIGLKEHYIFLVKPGFPWANVLDKLVDTFSIIEVGMPTEGAACTALLARDLINNDESLLIANSDQYVKWDQIAFFTHIKMAEADGGILWFESIHPRWSYIKTAPGDKFYITEVAEKNPISNKATCGIYYFTKGSDFIRGAEKMIKADKRVNREFYICPVYNELIIEGKEYIPFKVDAMYGLGTPEDVNSFNRRIDL